MKDGDLVLVSYQVLTAKDAKSAKNGFDFSVFRVFRGL